MSKTKINWLQAFQDYISHPTASLADVAEKYDVSLSRVKKVSMEKGWHKTKKMIRSNAKKYVIETTEESMTSMIKRQQNMARQLQTKGLDLFRECVSRIDINNLTNTQLIKAISTIDRLLKRSFQMERELYTGEFRSALVAKKDKFSEVSPELAEAVNETLKKKLRSAPRISTKPSN